MPSLHLTEETVPHPAVSMLGRSETRQAVAGDLRVASDTPVWKVHYFARGHFHWQTGDEAVHIRPQSWLVVPPSVLHGGQRETRERGLFYWFHLEETLPWPGCVDDEMPDLFGTVRSGVYPATEDHTGSFETLLKLSQSTDTFRRGRFAVLAGQVIHALLDDLGRAATGALPAEIERVPAWIDAHLDESLRTEDLGRIAGLGRTRFATVFREAVGCPLQEYIHARRMREACELLCESGLPTMQIALSVGFVNAQAFATAFKRTHGISPTAWRKRGEAG